MGFDIVDDESKPERRPIKHMPKPSEWKNEFNPAYAYYAYYIYANLFTLNKVIYLSSLRAVIICFILSKLWSCTYVLLLPRIINLLYTGVLKPLWVLLSTVSLSKEHKKVDKIETENVEFQPLIIGIYKS